MYVVRLYCEIFRYLSAEQKIECYAHPILIKLVITGLYSRLQGGRHIHVLTLVLNLTSISTSNCLKIKNIKVSADGIGLQVLLNICIAMHRKSLLSPPLVSLCLLLFILPRLILCDSSSQTFSPLLWSGRIGRFG